MLASLISAGTSLLGGLFGRKSQEEANAKNLAAQREFAQSGVQWRVADAKKAGIHPLAALGAQTASFSPSFVGDTSFGTGIAQAGQDVSRAIDATRPAAQRSAAFEKSVQDLTVQKMGLENQILASQLAKINQAGHPPAFPGTPTLIDGQGNTTSVMLGGHRVDPSPKWSDAQEVEDRYGDVGSFLYFPFVAGADAARNLPAAVKDGFWQDIDSMRAYWNNLWRGRGMRHLDRSEFNRRFGE